MRKIILIAIILVTLASCKKNNTGKPKDSKAIETNLYKKGINTDTVFLYHKNGKVKEKGLLTDNNIKKGWWSYHDSLGNLIKRNEYRVVNDSIFLNQFIHYNKDKTINKEKSSYFTLVIPDTIVLGKNLVELNYISKHKNASKRSLSVFIRNQMSDTVFKDNVFGDDNELVNPQFGIYAHKTGKKIIKGYTIELVVYKQEIGQDSLDANIIEHKKYFEKEVFVKNREKS